MKGYTATRFLREFKTKNWTTGGLNTLLEKIDRTGSVDRVTGSDRPLTARTAGNVAVVEEMALKIIFIAVSAIFSVKHLIPQNY